MVLERDVGEGPSTLPLVQAHIRVRPITVRFTEPGVRDLELKLHTIPSLHPFVAPLSNTQHPQQHQQQQRVIFDFDFDTQHQGSHSPALHPPPPPPVAEEEDAERGNEVVQELVGVLQGRGLMGDDTVRAVKMRMAVHREGVRGRRLRLIHAGRILRDGVRLVGYLDELDLRTRLQTRQTQRLLALSDPHRGTNRIPNGERHSTSDEHDQNASMGEQVDEDKEEEEEQVERTEMSIRQLVDWLSAQLEYTPSDNNTAQIHGGGAEMEHAHWTGKGKGKDREPGWYDDVVQATIRTARTVYLQCSVGEAEPTSPPPNPTRAASSPLDSTHTPPPLVDTSTATLDGDEIASATWAPHRGFNRLLSAGLSASEIAEIRTTFLRSHPLETPYDLIRSHEHAQHLLQMEESWMDNLSSPDLADPTATSSSGGYLSVMHGLMLGFFAPPLIPLFWLRDKPHPSSIPSSTAIGFDSNEHDDADDEQLWHRETLALTRDSVFGNTMQISILFGLVANLLMGMFRFIW